MSVVNAGDMERYRETARRRREIREHDRMARLKEAWVVAAKAANVLRQQFHARHAVVFGSLVQPELFHQRSDIDIAVWGVEEREFLGAVAAVTGLDSEIGVDLVAVESAPKSLRYRIEVEGKPI